jgi:hypothetical protein
MYGETLIAIAFLFFLGYITHKTNGKYLKKISKDWGNAYFRLGLIGVGIFFFSIIMFSKNARLRGATKKALIGLIIAYFAHLDMIFAAFIVLFIIFYFYHKPKSYT